MSPGLVFDVVTPDGIKIEVKCSAYVQTWAQKRPSRITFGIAPRRAWDPATNTFAPKPARSADVYVFALHAHRERNSLDPLDVSQWDFYVLATQKITAACGAQKTIRLGSLLRLGPRKVKFGALAESIRAEAAGPAGTALSRND